MRRKIIQRFLLALLPFIFTLSLNAQVKPYYSVQKMTVSKGVSLDKITISGPPKPPAGITRSTVALPEPRRAAGINTLTGVPAFDWCFGCSATSASMIAGYYDRHGYDNMYTGPTNGGVMPLDNSSWGTVVINGETRAQCPLSATRNGLDGRVIRGHVDDYWILYGSTNSDPYITNSWTEHTLGDCTGDFMKTNRLASGNTDGSTTFYNYTNNSPLPAADMVTYGIQDEDGGYGIKLFYESRGYVVKEMYNQNIYGLNGYASGFTFAQFKAEIDSGWPVLINLEGHTIVGVGYDDATNLVYIHDTWDYSTHSMTWGSTYSGMAHLSVSIVHLDESTMPVELTTFNATTERSNTELRWKTATEINNYGFEVERRKVDELAQWIKVGFINGSGTSNSPHEYNYSDRKLTDGRYLYRLKQIDNDGTFKYSGSVEVEIKNIPTAFTLEQNYPNPFNPSTTIRFGLPTRSRVKLEVINILGQTVAKLIEGEKGAGLVETIWHANVASGLYIYRLEAVSLDNPDVRFVDVKKMQLLK